MPGPISRSDRSRDRRVKLQSAVLALALVTVVPGPAQEAPQPATSERPNILLIVTDDQRADTMSVMPVTRRLFGRRGTRFARAYTPIPLCCPARATIFSGRYPHNHDVRTADDAYNLDQSSTFQRYLDDAGYSTALVGKYLNSWNLDDAPPHFDRWTFFSAGLEDGADGYNGVRVNADGELEHVDRYLTDLLADRTIDYLRSFEADDGRPWLLVVAPFAPHGPAIPARRHRDARVPPWSGDPAVFERDIGDKPPSVIANQESQWHLTYLEARKFRARQLRALMAVDDLVAKTFAEVRELGEGRDTLALYMSDNGVFWGEHGLSLKGLPYEPAVRVPFFARWPGRIAHGDVDRRLIALQDVAPTILDAAGLAPDPEYTMDGRSILSGYERTRLLLEHWYEPSFRPMPTWAALFTPGDYLYAAYAAGEESPAFSEYYDLEADPWRLRNRSDQRDPAEHVLETTLEADRTCSGASCP